MKNKYQSPVIKVLKMKLDNKIVICDDEIARIINELKEQSSFEENHDELLSKFSIDNS